jgi:hypothetical protein
MWPQFDWITVGNISAKLNEKMGQVWLNSSVTEIEDTFFFLFFYLLILNSNQARFYYLMFQLLTQETRKQYLGKMDSFMSTDNHRNWRFRFELAE